MLTRVAQDTERALQAVQQVIGLIAAVLGTAASRVARGLPGQIPTA
jgi:hypothetical protein